MSEKNLAISTRRHLAELVPNTEFFYQRIESSNVKGIPDTCYCIRGKVGWIEYKYLEKFPHRKNTLVRLDHFTTEQRVFMHDYTMAGGKCFVFVQVEQEYFLFDGLDASMYLSRSEDSGGWRKADFYTKALLWWKQRDSKGWQKFLETLTK